VYFKDLKVIIKGQSCIDDANVLVGKIEWLSDKADFKSLEVREATMQVGNGTIKLKYLVVMDQPRKGKSKEPLVVSIDSMTLKGFKEWQGLYLAPTNASVRPGSAVKSRI
jgi:hypothetical protein